MSAARGKAKAFAPLGVETQARSRGHAGGPQRARASRYLAHSGTESASRAQSLTARPLAVTQPLRSTHFTYSSSTPLHDLLIQAHTSTACAGRDGAGYTFLPVRFADFAENVAV